MNKLDLLTKPHWNYKDVCAFVGCKKSKAYQIIQFAKTNFDGSIRFNSQCVKRDSILALLGTSVEREIYISKQLTKQLKGKEEE